MKKIIVPIVALVALFLIWFFISGGDKAEQKIVPVTLLNQGPFKYFQVTAVAESGVDGKLLLNGEEIAVFNKKAGKFVSEKAQDLIKDGNNSIELIINSAIAKDENEARLTNTIEILLNALKEPGQANKGNEVLKLQWNPSLLGEGISGPENISYNFQIKRDRSQPVRQVVDETVVTKTDKMSFIQALAKRREVFASKNADAIKTFYAKILPTNIDVKRMSESQVLSMAERDLKSLQIPDAVIDSSYSTWSKGNGAISITVLFNGSEHYISLKIIDGIFY